MLFHYLTDEENEAQCCLLSNQPHITLFVSKLTFKPRHSFF